MQFSIKELECELKAMTGKIDEFSREFLKAEYKVSEMQAKFKKLRHEKENAEGKIEAQKKEL